MFETLKVRRHDKLRQHQNKCRCHMGQDQVSGGVSLLFFLSKKDTFLPLLKNCTS